MSRRTIVRLHSEFHRNRDLKINPSPREIKFIAEKAKEEEEEEEDVFTATFQRGRAAGLPAPSSGYERYAWGSRACHASPFPRDVGVFHTGSRNRPSRKVIEQEGKRAGRGC
ncbi:hypothetical protein AAFF_G00310690 [Aldrovandia affinis]|uniref:Uncharacterized protein n=1 Tax=Aldrovandia affinis TaxID=143900 RepID=A0AAD7R7M4_9TELE|nr:hypothetical protein AAFF_G00310690 [Aldrovandia affinis]